MPYALLLYAALGSPIPETRDFARVELLSLLSRTPAAAKELELWAAICPCPETTFQVRKIITSHRGYLARNYVPTTVPVWPISDAIPISNPLVPFGLLDNRNKCFLLRCDSIMNYAPYWHGYRRATELHIRRLIISGASYSEVDQLVSRMWELEKRANGDSPPDVWEKAVSTWTRWDGGYPRKDTYGPGKTQDMTQAPPPR